MTDKFCRLRRPVPRTADMPRFGLLSPLHRAGVVEKCAAGALYGHCAEGARNARTGCGIVVAPQFGRSMRLRIEVIVVVLSYASIAAVRNVRDALAPPEVDRVCAHHTELPAAPANHNKDRTNTALQQCNRLYVTLER